MTSLNSGVGRVVQYAGGPGSGLWVCKVGVQKQQPVFVGWDFEIKAVVRTQREDPSLKFLFEWLESASVPSEKDLFLSGSAVKNYWVARVFVKRGSSVPPTS